MSNEEIKEFRALDKVRLVDIPSPHDFLNGTEAFVQPFLEKNDGTSDPGRAKLLDGRYQVALYQENKEKGEEIEYYKVKRKNLVLVEAGEVTKVNNNVSTSGTFTAVSNAETERKNPGLEGWYPAVLQGDMKRCREILEYIRTINYNAPLPPADAMLDHTGDTALTGAIQEGHSDIVDLLIEYGADVNHQFGVLAPMTRELNMKYLHLAITLLDAGENDKNAEKAKQRQDIVVKLIESGADVSVPCRNGTPIDLILTCDSVQVPWQYKIQVVKLMLQKGADPNAVLDESATRTRYCLSFACYATYFGSEDNRIEIVKLLLKHGADPGMSIACRNGTEVTTPLHCVVSRRQWQVLQVLLESEKGQQAVNKKMIDVDFQNGCTPLYLALNGNMVERVATRKCIVLLLQYGASFHIPNASGCPPYYGLTRDTTPIVKKLRRLVDNAPVGDELNYWASPAAQKWVGTWKESAEPQCPVCLSWTDDVPTDFKACSRCKTQHYCSKRCQKIHWQDHKRSCRAPIS